MIAFLLIRDIQKKGNHKWLFIFSNLILQTTYQEEWAALTEITKYSSFPYFSTNITTANPRQRTSKDDRVRLPITDEAATMTFYANYRKNKKVL